MFYRKRLVDRVSRARRAMCSLKNVIENHLESEKRLVFTAGKRMNFSKKTLIPIFKTRSDWFLNFYSSDILFVVPKCERSRRTRALSEPTTRRHTLGRRFRSPAIKSFFYSCILFNRMRPTTAAYTSGKRDSLCSPVSIVTRRRRRARSLSARYPSTPS